MNLIIVYYSPSVYHIPLKMLLKKYVEIFFFNHRRTGNFLLNK